jgi:crossover junction endodeoxyribonuclease RuvC
MTMSRNSVHPKGDQVILGIDPGTNIMGYGIISVVGGKLDLQAAGVIQLTRVPNHALKLKMIFEKTLTLIDSFKPDELSIEAPFFGKNVQSMLKLGRAQGVAMAAALYSGLPIFEYSPKKIKLAVTGNGNASKEQVAAMLQRMIGFEQAPRYLDATDGLAAAVCHYFQSGSLASRKPSSWKTFVSSHPDKIARSS